jgi:hypothetical protein
MRESMADMETDRVLRIEKSIGALLMWIWGVWALFHWHRQANGPGTLLEEQTTRIVHGWPRAPKDQFQALLYDNSIQKCFATQEASFTGMLITSKVPNSAERHGRGNEATDEQL